MVKDLPGKYERNKHSNGNNIKTRIHSKMLQDQRAFLINEGNYVQRR